MDPIHTLIDLGIKNIYAKDRDKCRAVDYAVPNGPLNLIPCFVQPTPYTFKLE